MWFVHDDVIILLNKYKKCAAPAGYREQKDKVIGIAVVETG